MRRDHSDIDTVNEALRLDRDRHREPWYFGGMLAYILAGWFLVLITWSLAVKTWEVLHG